MSVVVNGIEFEYLRNGPTLQNKNLIKDYILNQYINLFYRFKGIIDRAQCSVFFQNINSYFKSYLATSYTTQSEHSRART
jgi:conjugal transfer/entry exclusion protein